MTKFRGTLFGMDFVIGMATGITMEFEFGTNWAYYSHYVGDIFGAPLAIEGLMASFSTRPLSGCSSSARTGSGKDRAPVVTLAGCDGSDLRSVDFGRQCLDAGSGRRHVEPGDHAYGTSLPSSMCCSIRSRRRIRSHGERGLCDRLHVRAGDRRLLVLSGAKSEIARRSITVAAGFGLASALFVVVLGDESGYMTDIIRR